MILNIHNQSLLRLISKLRIIHERIQGRFRNHIFWKNTGNVNIADEVDPNNFHFINNFRDKLYSGDSIPFTGIPTFTDPASHFRKVTEKYSGYLKSFGFRRAGSYEDNVGEGCFACEC